MWNDLGSVSRQSLRLSLLNEHIEGLPAETYIALECFLHQLSTENSEEEHLANPVLTALLLGSLIERLEEEEEKLPATKASVLTLLEQSLDEVHKNEVRLMHITEKANWIKNCFLYPIILFNDCKEVSYIAIKYVKIGIALAVVLATLAGALAKHHHEACARAQLLPLTMFQWSRQTGKPQAERFFLNLKTPQQCE